MKALLRSTSVEQCKAAGDDRAHQKRPVHGGGPDDDCDCGYCHSCHYARKRHRRATSRLSTVRRLYGWAADELEALRGTQRGRCPICRRRVGVVKSASVDHDHAKQRAGVELRWTVRGLLCSTCNRYLGHIADNPEAGIRLALYLIDPPAPHVLTTLDKLRQDESRQAADPDGR